MVKKYVNLGNKKKRKYEKKGIYETIIVLKKGY